VVDAPNHDDGGHRPVMVKNVLNKRLPYTPAVRAGCAILRATQSFQSLRLIFLQLKWASKKRRGWP
jgi:hypothetical protein